VGGDGGVHDASAIVRQADIEDVTHLARAAHFDLNILAERYRTELRPCLAGSESRHDLTLS